MVQQERESLSFYKLRIAPQIHPLIFLFLSLYLTFPLIITSSFNRMTLA